jgi:hypothetical protein
VRGPFFSLRGGVNGVLVKLSGGVVVMTSGAGLLILRGIKGRTG